MRWLILVVGWAWAQSASAPVAAPAAAPPPKAGSCDGGELLFSCPVKGGKEIRVCGATGEAIWLTYTFGKPGVPELVFPTSRVDSVPKFMVEERSFVQSMGYVLSFTNGKVTYEVTEMMGAGGPGGETNNFAGVTVLEGEKQLAQVACTSPPTSNWPRILEVHEVGMFTP